MAAKKLQFFWQNWFDDAVVTASSEELEYPVENLQNRWATWDWRSGVPDTSGVWIKADLGGAKEIQGFILENMNLQAGSGTTVILGGHATDPGVGATAYTEPIPITAEMVTAKRIVFILPGSVGDRTKRWWRILITDIDTWPGYFSASRVYLGPVFQPKYHYQPRPTQVRASDSGVGYSAGGQTTAVKRPRFWTYTLPISIVGTDGEKFADMDEECGVDTPLWVCLDSTNDVTRVTSTIYVSFMEHIPFPAVIDGCLWESSLRLRQEL